MSDASASAPRARAAASGKPRARLRARSPFAALALLATAAAGSTGTANETSSAAEAAESGFGGDVPLFADETVAAGLAHVYVGPWEHFVGGGVAVLDCNDDRLPDLYLAGGTAPAALYVNASATAGALAFARRRSPATDLEGVSGAYPLDVDDDGRLDLVVLRVGENRVLRGAPDCRFTPANVAWNVDGGREWSTAFSATFEPGARFPTLAFGNYVDRSAPGAPWGTCADNALLRPRAVGAGAAEAATPRYEAPIALSPGHCALSLLFTDWNRSGRDALRVSNDRHYHRGGEEQLWRFDRGPYPRLYGRAEGWAPLVIWGMGIAEGDLDADGYPEYALSSMGDTKLQRLVLEEALEEGRPVYEDMAWARGATAHRPYTGDDGRPSTGWHAEFDDVNNDARLDLFIAKGNVEAMDDFAAFDPDNLLLGTHDGRFHEAGLAAGIARATRGRGAAVVDLNADGMLDLVVVNRGAPASLFRQLGARADGDAPLAGQAAARVLRRGAAGSSAAGPAVRPTGNWLAIELRQPPPNRHALGARLSVRTGDRVQTRRVGVGGGHASGAAGFVHVGLGAAERATLRVQWPDGEWSAPYRLFANHHVVVTRGAESVQQWFPPPAR